MTRVRVAWVTLYAVAMAAVEAAVVVYLRALHPVTTPQPMSVVAAALPPHVITIEMGREAATLVMLAAVAALAGRGWWERPLCFSLAFGVWDIFYYVGLWVFIGWPPSLLTWDVLFLLPVPWLAPVLAPVIVSVTLVGGALFMLKRPPPQWRAWAVASFGAVLILLSFTLDYRVVIEGRDPPPFRWWLFVAGVALGVAALGIEALRRRPLPAGVLL